MNMALIHAVNSGKMTLEEAQKAEAKATAEAKAKEHKSAKAAEKEA